MSEKTKSKGTERNREISLWDMARLLLHKLHWLVLAGLLAGGLVYLAVSLLITPTYKSRVSFYVFNRTEGSSQMGIINTGDLLAAESLATTYSKILASNSILDAVLNDLGPDAKLTRKELSKMVDVSVVTDTQLLEVVITSTDPLFACRVADAFAEVAPTEIIRITKVGGVEVVDQPEVATNKSSPRTLFDSAIGVFVGVIIVAVIIVVRSLSDVTIYLPEDVTAAADVTVLGQIPTIDFSGSTVGWELEEGGDGRHEREEKSKQIDQ